MTLTQKMMQLVISSRPISWVNTAYPFAAGYLLTTHRFDATFFIGTLYFLIPYNLLMYGINDVFDYESDLRNPRKGGVEGAKLHKPLHVLTIWAAIVTNVPFIIYLLIVGNWQANSTLAILIFFVVAYSAPYLRFKERPIVDSITSSTHFCGPLVYALVLAGWPAGVLPVVIAFFLWGMASHAFGAVQDVIADREGKISSIATIFGAKQTVRLSIALYILSGLILAYFVHTSAAWLGLLVVPYIVSIWPFRNISDADCEQANKGWKRFIYLNWFTGMIVTFALIAAY